MQRADFDAYLGVFNARRYDDVLAHFADDAVISFADVVLKGKAEIRRFYAFFHSYVEETIFPQRFLSDQDSLFIEAIVRLEAKHDLTAQTLEDQGYGSVVALAAGQVVELPQFIHYHLENGLFKSVTCVVAALVD